jgi:hypothetical protein
MLVRFRTGFLWFLIEFPASSESSARRTVPHERRYSRRVLRDVEITRYVTPLREGGSLPGLVEADDDGFYVLKFRAAGQGPAALVAEIVVAGLARALELRVPELVLATLDVEIGRREPDPEIQELLVASAGLNLGIDFLPGAFGYDGRAWHPSPREAAAVLWLDALTANIDRTWRNPNLLIWHRELWAIDHGAALVFQHAWPAPEAWAGREYDLSAHVLLPQAHALDGASRLELDREFGARLTNDVIAGALADVPDAWLAAVVDPPPLIAPGAVPPPEPSAAELAAAGAAARQRYTNYLRLRLAAPRGWASPLVGLPEGSPA